MKWKYDETTIWLNTKLMKVPANEWQLDETASWGKCMLLKCQVDEKSMLTHKIDEMKCWWNDNLMKWQFD